MFMINNLRNICPRRSSSISLPFARRRQLRCSLSDNYSRSFSRTGQTLHQARIRPRIGDGGLWNEDRKLRSQARSRGRSDRSRSTCWDSLHLRIHSYQSPISPGSIRALQRIEQDICLSRRTQEDKLRTLRQSAAIVRPRASGQIRACPSGMVVLSSFHFRKSRDLSSISFGSEVRVSRKLHSNDWRVPLNNAERSVVKIRAIHTCRWPLNRNI